MNPIPLWLEWAREIQALAQTGLHYSTDEYNRQRYTRLLEIAAEIVNHNTQLDYEALRQAFMMPIGYATPRVDVRAAVFQDGKLLMVREKADGGWTLPGGWADVGDAPSQAAERETWEEAGFHVKAQRLIGVYDANRIVPLEIFHAYKLVFLCKIVDGTARPSPETSEVRFFERDQIPEVLSGERTLPRHIEDALRVLENPGQPTIFD
ncbi:MAG: NUDIX hydrolase [Anaerolineales bacterium]